MLITIHNGISHIMKQPSRNWAPLRSDNVSARFMDCVVMSCVCRKWIWYRSMYIYIYIFVCLCNVYIYIYIHEGMLNYTYCGVPQASLQSRQVPQVAGHWSWPIYLDQVTPIAGWFILDNPSIWVNYNDLTATSLEIMVSKGNHPQMALIQVSEIL